MTKIAAALESGGFGSAKAKAEVPQEAHFLTPMNATVSNIKQALKRFRFLVEMKRKLLGQTDEVENFLYRYFSSGKFKTIVQVGANDGVMCDPLRRFIQSPGKFEATLVEPIPYYAEKLRQLYKNRSDVKVIQAALGSTDKTETLYFIPPQIADLMNGEGRPNNWAHGQGCFDRDTVVYWIEKNSFRGDDYCRQIPFFISTIDSISIPVMQIRRIMPKADNLLLVLDVQGFELEVLNGLDWSYPPAFLMLEDDMDKTDTVITFLKSKGYRCLGGKTDKIFVHQNAKN
jgi:FkbM family methyltransferase